MRHALATNQIPFALLKPLNGVPVLVRVFPAGDKQVCFDLFFLFRQREFNLNLKGLRSIF